MRSKKPNAADMTVKEFEAELRRIRNRALQIYANRPVQSNRSYLNQKRESPLVNISEPVANATIRVISLGAGVQSTVMALMAARGEIGPMPDCAIFADTGYEPQGVYDHLDWLETQLPFPVYRVSNGNIKDDTLAATNSTGQRYVSIPFYTAEGGMGKGNAPQNIN